MASLRLIASWAAAGLVVAMFSTAGQAADAQSWSAAPGSARARANPYDASPDAVRAGRKLFARHCTECHGADGRGGRNARPLSSDTVRDARPGELFWFVTNGDLRGGMPAWSRLPEARRWQIVAFLKTL
jgi:mono/diheme cytochrome c family protein